MALKSVALWTVLGALFLIPFLPLYVASDLFFPFISSKGFAFRIIIELAAGAYLLLALADKRYRPRWSWTLVLYGAFVAWMFVANLFAENAHKAFWSNYERMDGWVTLIHVFVFFVIAGAVLSADKLWKRWWLTVLGASALVSVHGVWQLLGYAEIHQGGARLDANFGNAIYLAVYLMFTILIATWQAVVSKGWLRWCLIALAALQVVLLFATATRGVILALFGAAILMGLAWIATSAGGKGRMVAGAAVGLLLVLGAGFYLARDSAFIQNEPALARLATVFDSNELTVRATLWSMAFEGAAARPITGWGQEGYNFVFNTYYKPTLYGQEPWFDRAHNEYLDWLVAGGYPALLLFVALLLSAFYAFYKKKDDPIARIFLAGALVAYAAQAVTAFDNLLSYILAAALFAMAHDASARPMPALERAEEVRGDSLVTIAAPVVLVVTVAVVWLVNVPSIGASTDLIRAASAKDAPTALAAYESAIASGSFGRQEIREQLLNFAGSIAQNGSIPVEVRQNAVKLAFEQAEEGIAEVPNDARGHLMYAQALRLAGNGEGALREIDAALALSPKKQTTLLQRGAAKWQINDMAGATADFEAAYNLDRRNKNAAGYLAAGRVLQGDVTSAKALLQEVYGSTIVDLDVLRAAYFETKRYDDLVDVVKLSSENEPGNVQKRLLLVQAYALAGRAAEARAEADAIRAAHPDAAATVATLLVQLGLSK